MTGTEDAPAVGFDVDAALAAAREAVTGTLYTFVVFDADGFDAVYVDDATRSFYADEEQMYDHFAEIHTYVHLDLAEQDLFTEELFPVADRVRFVATSMDYLTLARVYVDGDGLFLAIEPDEPVVPVVDAIEDAVNAV